MLNDNPIAAAHWLVNNHPDKALAYAGRLSSPGVPTERGWQFWGAVHANVKVLLERKTVVSVLSPSVPEKP